MIKQHEIYESGYYYYMLKSKEDDSGGWGAVRESCSAVHCYS